MIFVINELFVYVCLLRNLSVYCLRLHYDIIRWRTVYKPACVSELTLRINVDISLLHYCLSY